MAIRMVLPIATAAAFGAIALALPGSARGDALDDLLTRPTLTGDWGGVRTDLQNFGISPFARYLNEVAGNPWGGKNQDATYTDQFDFGFDADLGKLIGLTGGKIRVAASDRNGDSLSEEDIGNLFTVQQDFGGNQMLRLGELSYTQLLFDDRFEFKAGRIFAANDVAVSPLYCNLMNKAYCARPQSFLYDVPLSAYPVATWGGHVKVMPTTDTYLQVGAYEDNPSQAFKDGTDFSTKKATGVFIVGELAYLYDVSSGTKGMPGHYKIGFWHDTSDATDFYQDSHGDPIAKTGRPAKVHDGKNGGYILADQMVYKEDEESNQGLSAFAGITFADENTALFPLFAFGGLVYEGLIPGRDLDKLSFGFAFGHVSDKLAHNQRQSNVPEQTDEAILELSYQLQLTPWFNFMPDFQYVIRPGATGDIPNATVFGFQTMVTF